MTCGHVRETEIAGLGERLALFLGTIQTKAQHHIILRKRMMGGPTHRVRTSNHHHHHQSWHPQKQ